MQWQPIETAPEGCPVLIWKANTRECYIGAFIPGKYGPGWCTPRSQNPPTCRTTR